MCTGIHGFISAADTCEARMVFSTLGGVAQNVLHFKRVGGWGDESLTELASSLVDWWVADVRISTNTATALMEVTCKDLEVEDGVGVIFNTGLPILGTNTTGAMPNNVTVAISQRSGLTGRSRRGRSYFIGLARDSVVADDLAGGVAAAFKGYWENILELPIAGETAELSVLSLCADGAWRTTALVTKVTAISVNNVVDNMRRRLKERGA